MLENKKILVLAPHTDDGELGCGGLISKAVRQGATVFMQRSLQLTKVFLLPFHLIS
jgi:hypothetical protein